jgi:hypothetical protein
MSMQQARHVTEVAVPGAVIGGIASVVVGVMAMVVGQPVTWALVGMLALGVPFALVGGTYGALVALGYAVPGVFVPAALLWLVGFPLSRLAHETLTPVLLGGSPTPPADVLAFLAFQGLVSLGFAIGFIWLHERVAPYWFMRVKDHNPLGHRLYVRYVEHAEMMWQARMRKRTRSAAGRDTGRARSGGAATGRVRSRASS